MKIQFKEYDGSFELYLRAEDAKETTQLARFGTGKTSHLKSATVFFNGDGETTAAIYIGRRKDKRSHL